MNICIPVTENKELQSPVSAHFGSAPGFLIVETDTMTCRAIDNRNKVHAHGQCQPLAAIQGEKIDAIIVGGIGMGALSKLQAAGIKVFMGKGMATAADAIAAHKAGQLQEASPHTACSSHGHGPRQDGHGCGHHHDH